MRALVFERNLPRYGLARVFSSVSGSGKAVSKSPLSFQNVSPPSVDKPGWETVDVLACGICGSDLATVDAVASRYFEDIVSFPFIPGHEIVARRRNGSGDRVVIESVLSCIPRGIDPPCKYCATGDNGNCTNLFLGSIEPGLQIGYCRSSGGGFSESLCVHGSQLYSIPDDIGDLEAVIIEPTACSIHAVLTGHISRDSTVGVLGAGTLGLCVTAALRSLIDPKTVLVSAKYDFQAGLARKLGADVVCEPGSLVRTVRRLGSGFALGSVKSTDRFQNSPKSGVPKSLSEGCDVVIDCLGTSDSISTAMSITRPKGTIIMVGMPARVSVDLCPLWHREISLIGSYAYGQEDLSKVLAPGFEPPGSTYQVFTQVSRRPQPKMVRTFDLAIDLVRKSALGALVSASYPLERYIEAFEHAGESARRRGVKIALVPTRAKKQEETN